MNILEKNSKLVLAKEKRREELLSKIQERSREIEEKYSSEDSEIQKKIENNWDALLYSITGKHLNDEVDLSPPVEPTEELLNKLIVGFDKLEINLKEICKK